MNVINREDALRICDNAINLWKGQLGEGALIAVRKSILSLPDANDGWIPVEEKLPEKNGFYLVTLNNSCTDFCLWKDKKGFGMLGTRWYPCEEVTAWRDLPKPYEPKEKTE